MTTSTCSRKAFLGGLFGSAFLAGCRTAGFGGGRPNLRLGILADIHVSTEDGDFNKFGDAAQFRKALAYFREHDVDGVIIAGDMADNGLVSQLRRVGEAWDAVFPGDCGRDGRHVEKLFVYGNHDLEGQNYDSFAVRFQDRDALKRGLVATDPAKAWETVFHEKYEPIWMKSVKGYQVIGAHWDKWDGIAAIGPWFEAHAAEIDRAKPFFFIQHPHPKDTCFGPDIWGHDAGYSTDALSKYPNAVAFSGHAHCPATDDRFIWQGSFTSVGVGSLRYGSSDSARTVFGIKKGSGFVNASRRWHTRQGMMLDVYDFDMVLRCRDFVNDEFVRDDVVIPIPAAASMPWKFEPRAKSLPAPAWPKDAKVSVSKAKDWEVSFPAAHGGASRVFGYVLNATGSDGASVEKYALHPDFDFAARREGKTVSVRIPFSKLPEGAKVVSVVPVNWFGSRGEALRA